MTTPMQLINELNMLSDDLDHATEDMINADYHATDAEQKYRMAYAKAFLEAQGTVQQKEQITVIATSTERYDMEIAKQILRASKANVDSIKSRIEVSRSLSALTRSEMALTSIIP
jgi:hypothetical protein